MPKSIPVPSSIIRALNLSADPSKTTFSTHGFGSGFATTGRIRASVPKYNDEGEQQEEEEERNFFVKTSSSNSKEAEEMFRGEYASLNAIADSVPELCPRALAWGDLHDDVKGPGTGWFLATEFLELGGMGRSGKSLAKNLGRLHSTPAPPPPQPGPGVVNSAEDGGQPGERQFGFPVPTFCGDVKQPNRFRRSWAQFYAEERLMNVLKESEKRNGKDKSLRNMVELTVSEVVPRLLGDGHLGYDRNGNGQGIVPVVVHGDLWSGNASKGRIVKSGDSRKGDTSDLIYDPSACYAHSEFELGIMKMFGGFGSEFFNEYHRIVPKTEPVEEYEDRVSLYEL